MHKIYLFINFIVYLLFKNFCRIKLAFLKIKNQRKADEYAYKLTRDISNYAIKITKTQIEVIGEQNIPSEACVFISNHQGNFDAFLFPSIIRKGTGCVAKKELKKIPIIGALFKAVHAVFIDRNSVRDGLRAINEAAENVKKGYSMTIFPEGTRSLSSKIGKFKKGSIKLAIKSKSPIVPVSLNGTYRIMEKGINAIGNRVTIMFHKPIYIDKLSRQDQNSLNEKVRDIIQNGLNELLRKDYIS